MDPVTASLLASGGLQFGSALLGGNDQRATVPFRDIPVGGQELDPVDLLGAGVEGTGRLADVLARRAQTPISLPSAFAQSPPQFTGGGLPLDIGVTAADPALGNDALPGDPSLLTQDPFGSSFGETTRTTGQGIIRGNDPGIGTLGLPGAGSQGTFLPQPATPAPVDRSNVEALDRTTPVRREIDDLLRTKQSAGGASSEDLIGAQRNQANAAIQLLMAGRGG